MPRWQPDSASTKCYLCKAAFTFFYRRHHCRNCGQLVCVKCASQSVPYLSNANVVNVSGTPETAKPGALYRTCDICCDEIALARRQLVAEPDPIQENEPILSSPVVAVNSGKKPSRISASRSVNDADICPVCGINLVEQFTTIVSPSEGLEPYKEAHVSQCLTFYDFANDNLRLSSPPNGAHARNRMLVYNVPPIPDPIYEPIKDSSPNSADALSSATLASSEKQSIDDECVICLEDLNPGDKVGRLECLCVFHYKCIKDWFNKKSFSECPVHFLHS